MTLPADVNPRVAEVLTEELTHGKRERARGGGKRKEGVTALSLFLCCSLKRFPLERGIGRHCTAERMCVYISVSLFFQIIQNKKGEILEGAPLRQLFNKSSFYLSFLSAFHTGIEGGGKSCCVRDASARGGEASNEEKAKERKGK
jgi:hypothetical protein